LPWSSPDRFDVSSVVARACSVENANLVEAAMSLLRIKSGGVVNVIDASA
jgi:hypothetical protein